MKYFAAALLFLFVSVSYAHPSTQKFTYKIDGVEYIHPSSWIDHNRFLHMRSSAYLWEHELRAFDHIVDNLDRRIDHLNATLKSLYLINCGSALTRPDECTRFAAVMHELLAYDKNHVEHTCPFNLVSDVIPVLHDNNLYIDQQQFVYRVVDICWALDIQNQAQLTNVTSFMKTWIVTDEEAIIYKLQFGGSHVSADFNMFGFIEAYRASTPR